MNAYPLPACLRLAGRQCHFWLVRLSEGFGDCRSACPFRFCFSISEHFQVCWLLGSLVWSRMALGCVWGSGLCTRFFNFTCASGLCLESIVAADLRLCQGRLELCSCLWWLQWASLLLQQAICFAFFVRSCSVFSTKDDTSRGPLIKSSEHGLHVALGAISNPTAAPYRFGTVFCGTLAHLLESF